MEEEATIFVSIASYRDRRCGTTVRSLFERAAFPGRIRVGMCEQNHIDDPATVSCVDWDDAFLKQYYPQIRRVLLSDTDAAGPCYARYLCSLLYRNEHYFLQIDSHTLFVQHWDILCIRLLNETPDPSRSILSYYPIPEDQYDPDPPLGILIPVIMSFSINTNHLLQWDPGVYTDLTVINAAGDREGRLRKTPYLAAGFLFAPGGYVRRVPFDPDLPYLFMGEEALMTVRAFTAGYDVYTPYRSIVYHAYARHDQPSVYRDRTFLEGYAEAEKRAQWIMGMTSRAPPLMDRDDPYGLGHERTLQEYWDTIGYAREDFWCSTVRYRTPAFSRFRPSHDMVMCLLVGGAVVFSGLWR